MLYALFLGGVITSLIVIGILAFFPSPSSQHDQRYEELNERENELHDCVASVGCELTPQEQAELDAIGEERDQLYDDLDEVQDGWQRSFGIALIALATGLLALSLVRWDQAIVISNGLLVGGMFTMIGGIGVTLGTGTGAGQFLMVAFASVVTLLLGYLRFARKPEPVDASAPAASAADEGELAERVAALEARLDEVRRALGG